MSHSTIIYSQQQYTGLVDSLTEWVMRRLKSGRKVTLTVADDKRTLPQNRHIHPVVAKVAKNLGRPTDKESLRKLRYLLLEQWRHETNRNPVFERSMDGMRWVSVDKGTSDLDVPDCTEFIEWLIAQEAQTA